MASLSPARQVHRCRICEHATLEPFLDLGTQPPANALLDAQALTQPEPFYPLGLASCRTCELIQLTHVVAPDVLFRHYMYFSSVSTQMAMHFADYATDVAARFVPSDGLVVEIGSNDGILLKALQRREDIRILGVDPAVNVADQARANGIPTVADFFGEPVARTIVSEHGVASAIIGNNVFAHIDDLHDVMRGVDALLAPNGVLVLEFPYVIEFLDSLEFDTVYHEHVSYLGVRPLGYLFARYGLEIFEVRPQAVHGGSVRVFARRRGGRATPVDASVAEHDARELRGGSAELVRLRRFADEVTTLREQLRRFVAETLENGQRIVGYTAPAKGTVLLNYCGIDASQIAYLADATPAKQGRYVPGVHIPIVSPEHFRADQPDVAMLLAWNHQKEILAKESAYRQAGGKFLLPIPHMQLL